MTVQTIEYRTPIAIFRINASHVILTCRIAILPEVIGITFTLGIAILELVAELQEGTTCERFAIGSLNAVAVVLLWGYIITVCLIGRVAGEQLIQTYKAIRELL